MARLASCTTLNQFRFQAASAVVTNRPPTHRQLLQTLNARSARLPHPDEANTSHYPIAVHIQTRFPGLSCSAPPLISIRVEPERNGGRPSVRIEAGVAYRLDSSEVQLSKRGRTVFFPSSSCARSWGEAGTKGINQRVKRAPRLSRAGQVPPRTSGYNIGA